MEHTSDKYSKQILTFNIKIVKFSYKKKLHNRILEDLCCLENFPAKRFCLHMSAHSL